MCSDFHLDHKNLGSHGQRNNGKALSVQDNYDFISENWRAHKRDLVFLLGDIIFSNDALDFLSKLPGKKRIVLGNHDYERFNIDYTKMIEVFEEIRGVRAYKGFWLSHFPIHQSELYRKRGVIHGHIHDENTNLELKNNPRYFNVNIDVIHPKYDEVMLPMYFIKDEFMKRIVIEEMIK